MGHKTRLSNSHQPPRATAPGSVSPPAARTVETAVRTLILPGRAGGCEPGACRPCHDSPPAIRNKAITRRIPPRPDVRRYVRGRAIADGLPAGCGPPKSSLRGISAAHRPIRTDGFRAQASTTGPPPARRRPVGTRTHDRSAVAEIVPFPRPYPYACLPPRPAARQWINSAPPTAISRPGHRAWRTDSRLVPDGRPQPPPPPVVHQSCPQGVDNNIHWIGPMAAHPAPAAIRPATRAATGA